MFVVVFGTVVAVMAVAVVVLAVVVSVMMLVGLGLVSRECFLVRAGRQVLLQFPWENWRHQDVRQRSFQDFGGYFHHLGYRQDLTPGFRQGFAQNQHSNFLQGFHAALAESFDRVNSVAVAVVGPAVVVLVVVAVEVVAGVAVVVVVFAAVAAAVVAVVAVVAFFAFAMVPGGCLNQGSLSHHHCHRRRSQAPHHLP